MDGRPNRRNKAAFSRLSGVMWTLPELELLHRETKRYLVKVMSLF